MFMASNFSLNLTYCFIKLIGILLYIMIIGTLNKL